MYFPNSGQNLYTSHSCQTTDIETLNLDTTPTPTPTQSFRASGGPRWPIFVIFITTLTSIYVTPVVHPHTMYNTVKSLSVSFSSVFDRPSWSWRLSPMGWWVVPLDPQLPVIRIVLLDPELSGKLSLAMVLLDRFSLAGSFNIITVVTIRINHIYPMTRVML